jgi:RimK family alpha-L-glutamate ligase
LYKIGIVTAQFEVDPTSHDLFEAAKRVAEAHVVDPIQFSVEFNGRHTIKIGHAGADEFDALIIRGLNFSGETDFQFEVFEQLDREGIAVINSPAALQVAESKFLTSFILQEKGFRVPESLIVQELDDAKEFLAQHTDIVAKPLYGFQGYGVIRVKSSEKDATTRIKRLLNEFKCICFQRFIPNPGRDIRAFVVGDEVVASIYRLARVGRWKTNIRAGAQAERCELTDAQREMATRASRDLGLDYTGVDIIEGPDGDYILEVNGAPAWHGIIEATGRNVAEDIIHHIIHRLERRAG